MSQKAFIIDFKDSIFFVFVQVYVYKSLVNIRYSIPLESSLYNRL
jgi:hypothetical protein